MILKVPSFMKTPPDLKPGMIYPCPMCMKLVIVNSDGATVRKMTERELRERSGEILDKLALVRALMPIVEVVQAVHEVEEKAVKEIKAAPYN